MPAGRRESPLSSLICLNLIAMINSSSKFPTYCYHPSIHSRSTSGTMGEIRQQLLGIQLIAAGSHQSTPSTINHTGQVRLCATVTHMSLSVIITLKYQPLFDPIRTQCYSYSMSWQYSRRLSLNSNMHFNSGKLIQFWKIWQLYFIWLLINRVGLYTNLSKEANNCLTHTCWCLCVCWCICVCVLGAIPRQGYKETGDLSCSLQRSFPSTQTHQRLNWFPIVNLRRVA